MRFSVRLLFGFLSLSLLLLTFSKVSFAQTTTPSPTPYVLAPDTNPNVPQNMSTYTQSVMLNMVNALNCQLTGINTLSPMEKCLGVDQKTGKIGFVENGGGVIGVLDKMTTALFVIPVHSINYISYLKNSFGIAKPTYAAAPCDPSVTGIGFCGLTPLLDAWSAFRNLVYLLFTFVFVVIGIAIMLRVKLDPRTVMTIQNQIPKIIIGIVLVTFSFAIAGFLVDMMYVSIYLVFGIFNSIPHSNLGVTVAQLQGAPAIEMANHLTDGGIFGVVTNISSPITGLLTNMLGIGFSLESMANLTNPLNDLIHALSIIGGTYVGIQVAQVSQGLLSAILPANDLVGAAAGAASVLGFEALFRVLIPNAIIFLVIFIAIIFALFRLWFVLIQAYIFILIDVIFSPFYIIAGLLPGSKMNFESWLRDIVSNLSAFPVTIGMFLLGRTLISALSDSTTASSLFVPPLVGNPVSAGTSPLGAIIALGIILSTPNVLQMTKNALKAPKVDLGAPGKMLGIGQSIVGGTAGTAWSRFMKKDQYGQPLGYGAQFVDRKISKPWARRLLGWKVPEKQKPKGIAELADQRAQFTPPTAGADVQGAEFIPPVGHTPPSTGGHTPPPTGGTPGTGPTTPPHAPTGGGTPPPAGGASTTSGTTSERTSSVTRMRGSSPWAYRTAQRLENWKNNGMKLPFRKKP